MASTISASLYWIGHKDHSDVFAQGYVGVSSRLDRRFWEHQNITGNNHLKNAINKYGWDSLVKKVLIVGNKEYCLDIEKQLRPEDKIGWNIVKGGGHPPSIPWNKGKPARPEEIERLRMARLGKPSPRKGVKLSAETIAKIIANKPKTVLSQAGREAIVKANTGRKHELVTCHYCGKIGGITAMPRWHFNNCRSK